MDEELMKYSISPKHFHDYFDPESEDLTEQQKKQLACKHEKTRNANHGRMIYCSDCDKILAQF